MAEARLILGAVLAGGRSQRMGRDKAAMVLDGVPLLDRARQLLKQTGCQSVCVLGRPGEQDGLPDSEPGGGPGRALLDGLVFAHMKDMAGLLAIPVDMPLLSPGHLQALIPRDKPAACIYEGLPLPAFFPAALAEVRRERIRSVMSLVEAGPFEARPLPPDHETAFVNVNTPADWQGLSGRTRRSQS